jgi:hypothetical protein
VSVHPNNEPLADARRRFGETVKLSSSVAACPHCRQLNVIDGQPCESCAKDAEIARLRAELDATIRDRDRLKARVGALTNLLDNQLDKTDREARRLFAALVAIRDSVVHVPASETYARCVEVVGDAPPSFRIDPGPTPEMEELARRVIESQKVMARQTPAEREAWANDLAQQVCQLPDPLENI